MHLRNLIRAALVLLAVVVAAPAAKAEPHLAQREGWKCSRCHVNRTGGGKRTAFGYQYALTHLNAFASPPQDSAPEPAARPWRAIDPNLSDAVSVGADLRLAHATTFAKKVQNSFEAQEANLYVQADATQNLVAYADTSVAQGSVESREAFLMVLWRGFSVKAGYFLLPYGLRIWGDSEYVRQETGYNFASPDLGIELGWERGPAGLYIAATNGSGGGSDPDNAKKLSLQGELTWQRVRAGISGSLNDSQTRSLQMAGPYVGLTLGRLTLLGEADVISTRYSAVNQTVHTLAAYAQADLLVRRGLNLRVAYGYHDPDLEQVQDQRINVRAGIELSPMPFATAGLYFNLGQSVPQDEVGNADVAMAELHLFF